MATVIIQIGHTQDDLGSLVNVISPHPPFMTPVGINSKSYKEGVDFTSGDSLEFQIAACSEIKVALFTTNNGTVKTYTEAPLAGGGKKLTIADCTTDIKSLIVHDT
jgi:hypothetical protein